MKTPFEEFESPYLENEPDLVVPTNELSNGVSHAIDESPFAHLVGLSGAETSHSTQDGPESQEPELLDFEELGSNPREHVRETNEIPWRWVCALDLPTDESGASRGSGVLVGPCQLLTARHVLPYGDPVKLTKVKISPARNGDNADHPFGAYSIRRVRYLWPVDLALVTLDRKLPAALGFWGQDPAQAQLRGLAPKALSGKRVTVSGYPGDRCNTIPIDGNRAQKLKGMRQCMKQNPRRWASTLWRADGTANVPMEKLVYYDADTHGGQSGGPVVLSDGGVHVCVGIHINGTKTKNWGVRLTPAILGNVRDAINKDAGAAIASMVGDALLVQTEVVSREETDQSANSNQGSLESPLLEEDLFGRVAGVKREAHLAALERESTFQRAFQQGRTKLVEPAEREDGIDEQERASTNNYLPEEAEAYADDEPTDLEEGQKEIYYEGEAEYEDGETGEEKPSARMKFEIQTRNRIWRNDAKTASLLERKYGPDDFLVEKKGVRLESETGGVLEFETEWFRTWPKLKEAIEKAGKMTDDMNKAASAKHETTRKAFPFNIDHLRKGSKREIAQGFWDKKPGMEGDKEPILRAGEELEVEIIDVAWNAGIQSSESFLLEYYESFLRQHEWPFYRDGTLTYAKAILDAANTGGMTATELGKIRSFLQIIVNYIMRGQGGKESEDSGAFSDVDGMPPKQAFTLMSRSNFASMYKVLLTEKDRRLFETIVKNDSVLEKMGLDRKSPVFIKGYGTKKHEPGPTVHEWLAGIVRNVDLLSVRSGKGLSAAMGRYNVETRKGKKDRWLVKFETRNTTIGTTGIEAKDWVQYASKLFDLASKRERDALNLLQQQGIVDENKLANFVFHARHPELGGRRILKGERGLAQEWLQIRNDLVRPLLQGIQHELEVEDAEDR